MSLDLLFEAEPVRIAREALPGWRAWIVGGAVRDALLGRPVVDVDLAVDGAPEEAARAIGRAGRGPSFELSAEFGAWRSMPRGKNGDGPRVCDVSPLQGGTIEEDLVQRDFSIDAMAVPLEGGELIDPPAAPPTSRPAACAFAGRLRA